MLARPESRTRTKVSAALTAAAYAVLALAGGCGNRTETYDIRVHNATTQPVTIVLTKEAPRGHIPGPNEEGWKSPEDLASGSAVERQDDRPPAVPPGHDARVRNLHGSFDAYTRGVLRCYWGDMTISQMVARGPGSPDRVDVPLAPGRNDVTILGKYYRITAQVEQELPRPRPGNSNP